MLEDIRSLDRQLHDAAQPLTPAQAAIVARSLGQDPFAGSLWSRLTGRFPGCDTAAALDEVRTEAELALGQLGLLGVGLLHARLVSRELRLCIGACLLRVRHGRIGILGRWGPVGGLVAQLNL